MTGNTSDGLEILQVSAGYGRVKVIRELSLPALARGTLTALVGPNAAGKSTLLRGLAGLGQVSGTIRLGGRDLASLSRSERARRMTYMPQTLPPGLVLAVIEAVISAQQATAIDEVHGDASTLRQAYDALERIGIADLAMTSLAHLSGGQRQLAGLAQAIVRRPEILLLDEPTSALDLRHQIIVMDCLRSLVRERGTIGIIVLHDITLAARFASHVAVLDHGTLGAFGTPADALTSAMLARVYGVSARVRTCERGALQVIVDHPLPLGNRSRR
jgi:iron complex transport system ATP-binding protein